MEERERLTEGRKLALGSLALIGALCLASILSLPRLEVDPEIGLRLPTGFLSEEAAKAERLFPRRPTLVASLPIGDPISERGIAALALASETLEKAGEARDGMEAAWRLVSPLTTCDFALDGDTLLSSPLVRGPRDDPAALRERFMASSLFASIFLSSDGKAWTFILETSAGGELLLSRLGEARSSCPDLLFAGLPYTTAMNGRILKREFYPIMLFAALALFLAEIFLFGRFRVALVVWIFSLIPALFLLGLFAATGTSLKLHLVLAPALALCLSTSYVVHLYHGWRASGLDAREAVRSRGSFILLDAATTVLGFSGLFFSPIGELREIAAFAVAAALVPLATTLLGLAPLLHLAARGRTGPRAIEEGLVARASSPRSRLLVTCLWTVFAALLSLSALRLKSGNEAVDFFRPGSAQRAEAEYFAGSYSGIEEIGVILDTGEEYGILDMEFYRAAKKLEEELCRFPDIGSARGYADAVGELLARWEGLPGSLEPRSPQEIGEALELLSSSPLSTSARFFVDADWSAVRIRLSLGHSFRPARDIGGLRASLSSAAAALDLPEPLLDGIAVKRGSAERIFIDGQFAGDILFFGALIAGLALALRSFKRALVVAMAPVTGLLASLAVLSIFGWPFSSVHAVALGVVLGTGVDNAIMLALGGWTGEIRAVGAEAALLVACGFTAFLAGSSYFMVQTAVACMAGLGASTIVANTLVPALLAGVQFDRKAKARAPRGAEGAQ